MGPILRGPGADGRFPGLGTPEVRPPTKEETMRRRRASIPLALIIVYLALLALIAIGILGLAAPN